MYFGDVSDILIFLLHVWKIRRRQAMRMSLGCKFKCLRKWKLWFTLLKCSIYEKAKISIFFPLLQVWGITGVKQWECLLAASLNLLTFKFLSCSPALFTVQSILVYTMCHIDVWCCWILIIKKSWQTGHQAAVLTLLKIETGQEEMGFSSLVPPRTQPGPPGPTGYWSGCAHPLPLLYFVKNLKKEATRWLF